MKNKKRKQRPQPSRDFWLDTDCCWFCKNRNGCGGCKVLKKYNKEYGNKKYEYKQKARRNYKYEI